MNNKSKWLKIYLTNQDTKKPFKAFGVRYLSTLTKALDALNISVTYDELIKLTPKNIYNLLNQVRCDSHIKNDLKKYCEYHPDYIKKIMTEFSPSLKRSWLKDNIKNIPLYSSHISLDT